MNCSAQSTWSPEEFRRKLEGVHGQYHHLHPFHRRMNAGALSPLQLRGWVANRFYYQKSIPLKDASILSNCPIREVRRIWLHRLSDHDGTRDGEGGIEAWLRLGEACCLSREEMLDERHVVPGVRFAVDAYLALARDKPWPVAIASSLTELFAPNLMVERIKAFEEHYTWVPAWGLEYFRSRVPRARADSEEGMELTLRYCDTRDLQEQAVGALHTKCDILRAQLDAISAAYCDPGDFDKDEQERCRERRKG
jgi:pyrroloquinoline-quinone synthase